jgi:hypothetical protein
MNNLSARKKLLLLIVIAAVLIALIIINVNHNGKRAADGPGSASAGTSEVENKGLVIEDKAVVEVDIPDDGKAAADAGEN